MEIRPDPRADGMLKENAWDEPMCGCPSRLKRTRSIALASVAVPTVERALAPMRSWSTMIAGVRPASRSTSGRASVGMKFCTKVQYVSLISRRDSAAIVSNTSELLPEPETPVNTVSRRFGISTLMFLRLFSRAPCTRMRSWLSAACSAHGCVSVLGSVLIVSPSAARGGLRCLPALDGAAHAAYPDCIQPLAHQSAPAMLAGTRNGAPEGAPLSSLLGLTGLPNVDQRSQSSASTAIGACPGSLLAVVYQAIFQPPCEGSLSET